MPGPYVGVLRVTYEVLLGVRRLSVVGLYWLFMVAPKKKLCKAAKDLLLSFLVVVVKVPLSLSAALSAGLVLALLFVR